MKKLFLIPLLFLCLKSKSQNTRWMYLAAERNGTIILVDTLKDDISQEKEYQGHDNIVLIWTNAYRKIKTKNGSYVTNTIERLAIDTINKQIARISYVKYKNDESVDSDNSIMEWEDIIPLTMGELYLKYAKSLNDPILESNLFLNAVLQYNPYNKKSKHQ